MRFFFSPQDVDRFVEQHNLHFGDENPIDLRIARAQAGATNLIWIMRKAKLQNGRAKTETPGVSEDFGSSMGYQRGSPPEKIAIFFFFLWENDEHAVFIHVS